MRDAPNATEGGFLRHFWTFVDDSVGAQNCKVGIAHQPPGNSMPSLHTHPVEEIYFVIQGTAAFWTDSEEEVICSELESVYFPPREQHAYRNAGAEDLQMLYVLAGDEEEMATEFSGDKDFDERYDG